MRGRAAQQVIRALKHTPSTAADIADELYLHKLDVYIGTLEELANAHGYDLTDDIVLSDEIDNALHDEAQLAASRIVSTFNTDLARFVAGLPDETTADEALQAVDAWQTARAPAKAQVIAIDGAYDAHADATLHFYTAAGETPLFDFGGHGDPEPECALCEAIKARNPHPLERVLEIGSPHQQCAQEWHARDVNSAALPDTIALGAGDVSGLVGQDPLMQRVGSRAKAIEFVKQMA
jgi:hypothetical protein